MKTKLLRKIRKNYKTCYYPEGYEADNGDVYLKNTHVLFYKSTLVRAEYDRKKIIDFMITHI